MKVQGGYYSADGTHISYEYDSSTNMTVFTEGPNKGKVMQGQPEFRTVASSGTSTSRSSSQSRSGETDTSETKIYDITLPTKDQIQVTGYTQYQLYREALYRYSENPSFDIYKYMDDLGVKYTLVKRAPQKNNITSTQSDLPQNEQKQTAGKTTNWKLVLGVLACVAILMFSGNKKSKK